MWSANSYTVIENASLLLQGVELSIHSVYHIPFVSAVSKMTLTSDCRIEEGDLVFCINDTYISPSQQSIGTLEKVEALIRSKETTTLRLMKEEGVKKSSSPFYQIIVIDEKLGITFGKSLTEEATVIQHVSKVSQQALTGSLVCGFNELCVLDMPVEQVNLLFSRRRFPLVLLLASPLGRVVLSRAVVEARMERYAVDLIAARESLQSGRSSPPRTEPSDEWFVEEAEEGVDHYMFPRTMGYLLLEKQYKLQQNELAEQRDRLWQAFLKSVGGVGALTFALTRQSGNRWRMLSLTQRDKKREELRGLIHAGVPDYLRGDVWFHLSGGFELKQQHQRSYLGLCQMPIDPEVERAVSLDIGRTFANNRLFSTNHGEESPYLAMLRCILYAISHARADIKYCQGLNYIAALLLLVQHDEETAFWTLFAIMEHLFPRDYFNEQLTGARIDQKVFEQLVQRQIPELVQRLQSGGFDLAVFTLPWFICLFINTLPFLSVMRVWDVVMFEGDKALIRIALALLSVGEKDLLSCNDFTDFSNVFKHLGMLIFDADNLLDVAYQKKVADGAKEKVIFFRRKELEKWRNDIRRQL